MQLIKGISNDLKKLDEYFSGTTIFGFFSDLSSLSPSVAFHKKLALYLKDDELFKAILGGFPALFTEVSSLLN